MYFPNKFLITYYLKFEYKKYFYDILIFYFETILTFRILK
jgi:hypothetical protein